MAAIFKRKPGELHIYLNRVPKADGREPWLVGPILVFLLFLFRAAVLLALFAPTLFSEEYKAMFWSVVADNPFAFLADIAFVIFLGAAPCMQFRKLVFSAATGEVYDSLLFFRRRVAGLAELGEVELSSQEFAGFTFHAYVVTWRDDKLRKPIRVSPKARRLNRLARYYHTVAPLLAEMLRRPADAAERDGLDAVEVEEFEIPVEEARHILGAPPAPDPAETPSPTPPPASAAAPGTERTYRRFRFMRGNGLYRSRMTLLQLSGVCLAVGVMIVLLTGMATLGDSPHLRAALVAYFLAVAYLIGRESLWIGLDPDGRAITVYDCLGLRKKRYPLADMVKVTLKHYGPYKALAVVLKGRKVDPGIVETLSMAKVREAVEEFSDILGLDPDTVLRV